MARIQAVLLLAAALAITAEPAPTAAPFTLPKLPYNIKRFETAIDEFTMNIHWNRHAYAFVHNLISQVLPACPELRGQTVYELVTSVGATRKCRSLAELRAAGIRAGVHAGRCPVLRKECETLVRNNAGGLWNHGLFFLHNLAPFNSQSFNKDASPQLKAAVQRAFGGYEGLKAEFTAKASSLFGSGWTWLVVDNSTFKVVTTPNQDNPLMPLASAQGLPILGLDEWEHAYYLRYYNVRPFYIAAFFSVINWKGVSEAYAAADAGKYAYAQLDVLVKASNWP